MQIFLGILGFLIFFTIPAIILKRSVINPLDRAWQARSARLIDEDNARRAARRQQEEAFRNAPMRANVNRRIYDAGGTRWDCIQYQKLKTDAQRLKWLDAHPEIAARIDRTGWPEDAQLH